MREEIFSMDTQIGKKRRLIKRAWKVDKSPLYPDGMEFAFQYLYLKNDEWIQIARIDNQLHEGKPGPHIHTLQREVVRWENIKLSECEGTIIGLGESVIKNILGDYDEN